MLSPEQAEKELAAQQKDGWVEDRIRAAKGLRSPLREAAGAILDEKRAQEFWEYERFLIDTYGPMSEDDRRGLFEFFFPQFPDLVERAWALHARLPCEAVMDLLGYFPRPFRAPSREDLLLLPRAKWVHGLIHLMKSFAGRSPAWFAAWAPHIQEPFAGGHIGVLLAAAIDGGGAEGDEVFDVLRASAAGEHPIGGMGRHVTSALLCCARPEAWSFVEQMLLAAQRQEGLRQTILETVHRAHPDAFRRMLRLIVDERLARFSATVRALDVWLRYRWDAVSAGIVNDTIEHLLRYFDDDSARRAALRGDDAEQAYVAAWSLAFDDVAEAVGPIRQLRKHKNPGHRYVATHLLDELRMPECEPDLVAALDDPDLHVSARVLERWAYSDDRPGPKADHSWFPALERQMERYPVKRTTLKPLVWPWTGRTVSRDDVAKAMLQNLGATPRHRLIPHLGDMEAGTRFQAVVRIVQQDAWDSTTRDAVLGMMGDASAMIRSFAADALRKKGVSAAEAERLEPLLTRSAGDLRRGVLTLLRGQPDPAAFASADRLLGSRSAPQRLAGLELLRGLVEDQRVVEQCRSRAAAFVSASGKRGGDVEQQHLDVILRAGVAAPTAADALGLAPSSQRTWASAPAERGVRLPSPVSRRILETLAHELAAHAESTITAKKWDGSMYVGPLGQWHLGHPDPHRPVPEDRARLPLADVWERWWLARGSDLRDDDGMELPRALALASLLEAPYQLESSRSDYPEVVATVFGSVVAEAPEEDLKIQDIGNVCAILDWMLRLHAPPGVVNFVLEAAEQVMSLVKPEWLLPLKEDPKHEGYRRAQDRWRWSAAFTGWLGLVEKVHGSAREQWTAPHASRVWSLWRWMDEPRRPPAAGGEPVPPDRQLLPRHAAPLWLLCEAHETGAASDADVVDVLIGERSERGNRHSFLELRALTRRKGTELARFPRLRPLVDRCRDRVIEVELTRGDTATAASVAAMSVRSVWGIDTVVALLRALGQRPFKRGYAWDKQSVESVFSHLIRSCLPRDAERPADFGKKMAAAKIPEERFIELAVYAPQWAPFVEQTVGWKGLTEGVWWVHGHTKSADWTVDQEIRELWKADLSTRTALDSQDLLDGAVDVQWFQRIHDSLGKGRWEQLYEAAKYASSGAGHARARLFADAMLGTITRKELAGRISGKRHQDAVRALGLLPLAPGKKRDADVLERYRVIQEFRRSSRQFGSQRQASEKRAAQVGLDNLARTAGFADPIRLQWAMEARAIADLAEGPITVKAGDVTLLLAINPWGDVELTATKGGKTLADVPAKLKQQPNVKALRERKTEVKRQASRIRPSLEQLMIRGDSFTGAELTDLLRHPLLSPMLRGVVLVADESMGYPVQGGKALEDHAGKIAALGRREHVRIAHPLDLLPASRWHEWQRDCFARERVQPFKQVFRELYTLTAAEKSEETRSLRYAGHQVNPRQAMALLGHRGWVNHPEEGVRKTFHEAGLMAWVEFEEPWFTPAEVEGLTLEAVRFGRRGEGRPMKLADVPPRLFSEAMRDLDLVVSVAHRGGVDPEASASSVEMRAALVRQAAALLKLDNVRLKANHVIVDGALARYSIHLGSAVTHKLPGDMLIIVPVHGQHRGRLFLPFADDDPKSAEVLSKVLLLARDREIKDPNILEQIR